MGVEERSGMLERAVMLSCLARNILNVALSWGSSIHGKARLASVAWN